MLNQDEVVVPAYICVPSYTFETAADNSQGANTHAINDMWITENGTLRGTIGVPSLLPIQTHGLTEIRIDAGVNNTGQTNSRVAYPFMASYYQTKDLKPGVIDTIIPVFKYVNGTGFKFIEDFDRVTRSYKFNSYYFMEGDTVLPVDDKDTLRQGDFCGKVVMPSAQTLAQLVTSEEYELPGYGAPVYLEIDYKSNLPLDIGYYYIEPNSNPSAPKSVVGTYETSTWKKLYVDMSGEISVRKPGTKYIMYIGIYNIDHITPLVYIDNIKLLYFK
jgi:hypothetical protein